MRSKKRKVCVVTGSRSEYGLLRWLMQDLKEDPRTDFKLAVTGAHWSKEFGFTYRDIEKDGFHIDARIKAPFDISTPVSLAKAAGAWTQKLSAALAAMKPDLVLIMGDRYELLSVGSACVVLGIPIGHISGGEITESALDEQVRHAITKMAHLHFVAHDAYARHVRQMGEEPWRVCLSGEPGLDALTRLPLLSQKDLEADLGLDLSRPTALVTFHPVTRESRSSLEQFRELTRALPRTNLQCIMTYPNADPGSRPIIQALRRFASQHPRSIKVVQNLGQQRYLSLLKTLPLMVGNSSSGLVEAPSFNLPAVNIGNRQKGRLRAATVIDVECRTDSILLGIRTALAYDRSTPCVNPYGTGQASTRIRSFIADIFSRHTQEEILRKRFIPLSTPERKPYIGGAFELDTRTLSQTPRTAWQSYLGLDNNSVLLGSGRSAFAWILRDLNLKGKTVLIPDYFCAEATLPVLKEQGVGYRYFPVLPNLEVDQRFLLNSLTPDVGAVVLINYFGLTDTRSLSRRIRARRPKLPIIQDDAQALYELHHFPAEKHWADYVFTSFMKWDCLPDGACVRQKHPRGMPRVAPPGSEQGVTYLLGSLVKQQFLNGGLASKEDENTEDLYVSLFEKAAREVPSRAVAMTALSRELMSRFRFEEVARQRRANYEYLARALSDCRPLTPLFPDPLKAHEVPLAYPVRVPVHLRDPLRAFLRDRKIFCPVHWPLPPEIETGEHPHAHALSQSLLSLPIDQRGTPESLERMVTVICEFMRTPV